jgi:hypothetical protein
MDAPLRLPGSADCTATAATGLSPADYREDELHQHGAEGGSALYPNPPIGGYHAPRIHFKVLPGAEGGYSLGPLWTLRPPSLSTDCHELLPVCLKSKATALPADPFYARFKVPAKHTLA